MRWPNSRFNTLSPMRSRKNPITILSSRFSPRNTSSGFTVPVERLVITRMMVVPIIKLKMVCPRLMTSSGVIGSIHGLQQLVECLLRRSLLHLGQHPLGPALLDSVDRSEVGAPSSPASHSDSGDHDAAQGDAEAQGLAARV